jgi:3-dehydroquinate synthase
VNFHYSTLSELKNLFKSFRKENLVVICDQNTFDLCLRKLDEELNYIILPAGEQSKSWNRVEEILQRFIDFNLDRSSVIVNLGGGVICDIGGFAASIYQRGIKFVNIPTSLMAMADAGYGGKNGINFNQLKNYIGTFNNPSDIYICEDFLETLPENEILSGFAEMIKHALLSGQEDWNQIKEYQPEQMNSKKLLPLIRSSNEFKWKVVNQDFNDTGIRRILNFGHTIGHALESLMLQKKLPLSHGEAVIAGMLCELELSSNVLNFPQSALEEIKSHLVNLYPQLPVKISDLKDIMPFMQKDKKNVGDQIQCCLLKDIGRPEFNVQVDLELVKGALLTYLDQEE